MLILSFVSSAFAEGTPGLLEDYSRSCVENAAGWGALGTPLILMTAGIIHEHLHSRRTGEQFDEADVFSFLGESSFWRGLVGCVALSCVASVVLPMLPIGPIISTMLKISAGFVGAELGQGTFGRADWTSISLQVMAATAAHFAFGSILSFCGIAAGTALLPALTATFCVISALTAAFMLDKHRQKRKSGECGAVINSEQVSYSASASEKNLGWSYQKLVLAGRQNDREKMRQALFDYQQLHQQRQLLREEHTTALNH